MRYSKATTKIDSETGNRIRESSVYPDIPITPSDLYIKALDGTRLDIISNEYYGTPKYWWVIALANKMGKGTLYVTPGYQLRIPMNPKQYAGMIR